MFISLFRGIVVSKDMRHVAITDVTSAVYCDSSSSRVSGSSVISQKPGGVVAVEAPVKVDRRTEWRGGWREVGRSELSSSTQILHTTEIAPPAPTPPHESELLAVNFT